MLLQDEVAHLQRCSARSTAKVEDPLHSAGSSSHLQMCELYDVITLFQLQIAFVEQCVVVIFSLANL